MIPKTAILKFIPVVLIGFSLCLQSCAEKQTPTLFTNIPAKESGILFSNRITNTLDLNILNYIYFYNGSGVAAEDFNNDGLIDIYLGSNLGTDALYLNKGSLKFEDITEVSRLSNQKQWSNGVTTVDINQDGWMDIYVCNVAHQKAPNTHNLLYINQGIDENGVPSFVESASQYGLDYSGYSTQAAFFDYDLDNDLDVFLLNHSTNPNQNYGKGSLREIPDTIRGDKLFENINGTYVDVSKEANIFQSKAGYGLGLAIADLNQDGYPDIYISNDFFENDYLYLNQQNKTFTEVIHTKKQTIGHTTHFSMGNDIADINNDGYLDILSVDMLPEDLKTYKTSGTEFNYQIYQNYLRNGYAPQYMQNTVQLNNGNGSFSEIAYLSNLAATEWSWSPLIADFDNDGLQDVYITNGILGATNDMDFINFIANENIQKSLGNNMTENELKFIDKIPKKKTSNYFFKNSDALKFEDVSAQWTHKKSSYSNGAAYADFDNDGDLDLIVNNVNEEASLLENTSEQNLAKTNSVSLKLTYKEGNLNGIGTQLYAYCNEDSYVRVLQKSRGYLSSVSNNIHIGLDQHEVIDSLIVVWPDRSIEKYTSLAPNNSIEIQYGDGFVSNKSPLHSALRFSKIDAVIDYKHQENLNLDFNRNPLLPFSYANEGPSASVADINNDGLEDFFIGGAKGQSSSLYIQKPNASFDQVLPTLFETNKLKEVVDHLFIDINNDNFKDLVVVYGGNEFKSGNAIQPSLYINTHGVFAEAVEVFEGYFINASKIASVDINNDGHVDLSILSNAKAQQFGYPTRQYLFINDGSGNFKEITDTWSKDFKNFPNAKDIAWNDVDNNGFEDALVLGHWSSPTLFLNDGTKLTAQTDNQLEDNNGWWNTLQVADFDLDGDLDIIAGNWGENSRLKASKNTPITLYAFDFDENNSEESILTYYYQTIETTLASKEELAKQIPHINKKYLSFKDFAAASVAEIFTQEKLDASLQRNVSELASCYFENQGDNSFLKRKLPIQAQIAPINDILIDDVNEDGYPDVILVGNNFELSTQLGRLDGQLGTVLINDTNGFFNVAPENLNVFGASRTIEKITIKEKETYLITRNNDTPIFIQKEE